LGHFLLNISYNGCGHTKVSDLQLTPALYLNASDLLAANTYPGDHDQSSSPPIDNSYLVVASAFLQSKTLAPVEAPALDYAFNAGTRPHSWGISAEVAGIRSGLQYWQVMKVAPGRKPIATAYARPPVRRLETRAW